VAIRSWRGSRDRRPPVEQLDSDALCSCLAMSGALSGTHAGHTSSVFFGSPLQLARWHAEHSMCPHRSATVDVSTATCATALQTRAR
jgi:hypothetical protein